jgi:hypothetical protein
MRVARRDVVGTPVPRSLRRCLGAAPGHGEPFMDRESATACVLHSICCRPDSNLVAGARSKPSTFNAISGRCWAKSGPWRKAAGVEPTRKRLTPPPGFEAQPYHRVRVPSESVAPRGASRCRRVTRANPARGAYSRRDRRIRGSGWFVCGPDPTRRDSGPHRRRRAVARDG